MTPAESEEAAETGSDDAEAFTSSGDESGFTDDIDSESITVDENKTMYLLMIRQNIAIPPILQTPDINTEGCELHYLS